MNHPEGGATGGPSLSDFVDVRECGLVGQVPVVAPDDVAAQLAKLGRTEDVAVSPDGERLAIAGFGHNELCIVHIRVDADSVLVRSVTTSGLDALRRPHGLAFLDDHTLIVANRGSGVLLVDLDRTTGTRVVASRVLIDGSHAVPTRSPGSVAVRTVAGRLFEVLICNRNHGVTRYLLDGADGWKVLDAQPIIANGVELPDGVAVSSSGEWIAISDHNRQAVAVYRYTAELGPETEPVRILRGMSYPHGICFTEDDRVLIVADAGLPHVHRFESLSADWCGDRGATSTTRVMNDELFKRGHINPQEGGPKGLAMLDDRIIVVTSGCQPLAFFRLEQLGNPLLRPAARSGAESGVDGFAADQVIRRLAVRLSQPSPNVTFSIDGVHAHARRLLQPVAIRTRPFRRLLIRRIHRIRKSMREFARIARLRVPSSSALSKSANPDLVVSLTSFPERIKWAWVPIETMLRQDTRPDRLVLVLSEADFPDRNLPRRLVRQQARGLEVIWTKSALGSYLKLLPTRLAYPDAAIITIDDDCIYESWLVSRLCQYASENPGVIVGCRGWEVPEYYAGFPPYVTWKAASSATPTVSAFLTGVGGVLYPPGSLSIDLLADESLAKSLCPTNDDIWFWAVASVTGTRVHCLGLTSFSPLRRQRHTRALMDQNWAGGRNDVQLADVVEHFGTALLSS